MSEQTLSKLEQTILCLLSLLSNQNKIVKVDSEQTEETFTWKESRIFLSTQNYKETVNGKKLGNYNKENFLSLLRKRLKWLVNLLKSRRIEWLSKLSDVCLVCRSCSETDARKRP